MDKATNITIDSYDKTAKEYYKIVTEFEVLPELEMFTNIIKKNGTILDLGCGPGQHAKCFFKKGFKVTGIDLSSEMIKIAKKEVPKVQFEVMDILNLKFNHEIKFDGIWASASLIHIHKEEVKKVLEELKKLLKKTGVLYISVKEGFESKMLIDQRYGGVPKFYQYYSQDEIYKILIKSGFKIIEKRHVKPRTEYDTNPWIHFFCKK